MLRCVVNHTLCKKSGKHKALDLIVRTRSALGFNLPAIKQHQLDYQSTLSNFSGIHLNNLSDNSQLAQQFTPLTIHYHNLASYNQQFTSTVKSTIDNSLQLSQSTISNSLQQSKSPFKICRRFVGICSWPYTELVKYNE